MGCVLPPLVLLSRLLAEIYQDGVFSSVTFFYAWTSISVGVSALLKVAVFGSVTSLSVNVLVDGVLLPTAFGLLTPVEAEWRFLLATGDESLWRRCWLRTSSCCLGRSRWAKLYWWRRASACAPTTSCCPPSIGCVVRSIAGCC